MKILEIRYGTEDYSIDVTSACRLKCVLPNSNVIKVPSGDVARADIFSDPLPHVKKFIYVIINGRKKELDESYDIRIDLDNSCSVYCYQDRIGTLRFLHESLTMIHGSLSDEVPEQEMSLYYLTGKERILEIGGNVGRNSLIISSVLQCPWQQLVVLECDPVSAQMLRENRDANHFDFHVEVAALSQKKLVQQGWSTMPIEERQPVPDGFVEVSTITWKHLQAKYDWIPFDTLVLDCEGAFFYILRDTPEILDKINLILMENDYTDFSHKEFVDSVLLKSGFYRDSARAGGWGPCEQFFFEAWKRR